MQKLSENEIDVFKRGRNTHLNAVPKGSTHEQYHAATGLEALFGYLYLADKTDRLNELFELIIEEKENAAGCDLPCCNQT